MFCVLALFSIKNYSQYEIEGRSKLPTIIPPSPTVSSLMKLEEVPIDYYSGQPNIGIPLFTKKVSANLSIPIGLNYSTSGIKIDNHSSWVGTGWSLESGGVISRTVRGLPDEQNIGTKVGVLHNPDFWDYDTLSSQDKEEFLWKANGTSTYQYDNQFDLYQFSFLGATGRFVITENLEAKLLTKNSNIKIDIDFNTTTLEINSFTLTDNNGNKFTFDVKELMYNSQFSARQNFNDNESSSGSSQTSVNAWYLSKVETSNNEELVNFNYVDVDEEYTNSILRTAHDVTNRPDDWGSFIQKDYNSSNMKAKKSVVHNVTQVTTKKLSSIVFRDDTSIHFNLSTATHPETAGKYLESITIYQKNTPPQIENKTFAFDYDTTVENQRLWLTKVTESTPNPNTPVNEYILEYNDKANLPEFDSESDDWGYRKNDYDTPTMNCDPASFDKDAIKKGLLDRIIYPNGGVKEFVFEHNTISYNGGNVLTSDEYLVLNPENWLPQNLNTTFDNTISSIPFTIQQDQNVIYNQLDVTISNYGTGTGNNEENILDNSAIRITNLGDNSVINIGLDQLTSHFTLVQGNYTIELIPVLVIGVELTTEICLVYKDYKDQNAQDVEKFIYGGGVRIKEVLFKDNATTIDNQRKITYSYDDDTLANTSSGATDGNFGRIVKRYNFQQTMKFITNVLNQSENLCGDQLNETVIFYSAISKGSYSGLTKGNYIGYKSVVVTEEDLKEKYIFTSPQDYASPNNVYEYPFYPAPNIDFKRGLLSKKTVLKLKSNGTYDNVREIENNYLFENDDIAPTFSIYSQSTSLSKQFYDSYSDFDSNIITPSLRPKCPPFGCGSLTNNECFPPQTILLAGDTFPFYKINDNVQSGWAKLDETIVKDYFYTTNNNQNVVETRQTFNYDPVNFRINEQTTFFTNNSYVQTNLFYPHTVSSSLFSTQEYTDITKLTNLNKINEVVYSQKIRDGVQIGASLIKYKEYLPNQVFPNIIQNSTGVEVLEDRITYHQYDHYGNPTELSKVNGIPMVYVWGYNHTQPVAKIINATLSDIPSNLINEIHSASSITGNETTLKQKLNDLRTHINSLNKITQINTLTYKLLIGVSSVIDQNGDEQTYHYDDFNRLQFVRDVQGNILSENQYNYRTLQN